MFSKRTSASGKIIAPHDFQKTANSAGQKNFWKRWPVSLFAGAIVFLLLVVWAACSYPEKILLVDSGPSKADMLVILGGSAPERPKRGMELFKAGEAPRIICSGSGDAEANETFLTNSGVPAAAILLEARSRTTRENAKFTVAILRAQHVKTAIIVTDWYHSRRALACFEHYGPDIKFYSRPSYFAYSRSEWRSQGINSYIKAEYVKLLGYWMCYGVCPVYFN